MTSESSCFRLSSCLSDSSAVAGGQQRKHMGLLEVAILFG
jgi:hypothetical protein